MPIVKSFRIQSLTVLAVAFALGQALSSSDLAAQAKSDQDLATDINDYITQNNLRDDTPEVSLPTITYAQPPRGVSTPQARVRPRLPSSVFELPSYESESKQRALRALDDVIQQDVLRDRRLPF